MILRKLLCHPCRYTNNSIPFSPLRTLSMRAWNVKGEPFKPIGILLYCKWLKGVGNAVLGASEGSIGTWWNPEAKSKVEKYLLLPSWSRISVILGRGYAEAIVFSFKALKSMTKRHLFFPCEFLSWELSTKESCTEIRILLLYHYRLTLVLVFELYCVTGWVTILLYIYRNIISSWDFICNHGSLTKLIIRQMKLTREFWDNLYYTFSFLWIEIFQIEQFNYLSWGLLHLGIFP